MTPQARWLGVALAALAAAALPAALLASEPLREAVAGGAEALAPPLSSIFPSEIVPEEGPSVGSLSSDHAGLAQALTLSVLLTGAMVAVVLVGRSHSAPPRLSSAVPDSMPAQKRALDHLGSLGVASSAQFLAFDPQTLAFWSGLPAAEVAELQGLVRLLEWPAVPKPTAQRLAEAGVGSIPALAVQEPAVLAETLRQSMGARLAEPVCSPDALAAWIVAARRHVAGEPPAGPAPFGVRERGRPAALAETLASA